MSYTSVDSKTKTEYNNIFFTVVYNYYIYIFFLYSQEFIINIYSITQ